MLKYIFLGLGLVMAKEAVNANCLNQYTPAEVTLKADGLTESQKVEHLLQYIRSMKGATFIRNGSEHSCKEAADHLKSKWEKHRSKINSANDFIDKLASRSGMSGEDYKIKFADGKVLTTKQLLLKELKRIEGK